MGKTIALFAVAMLAGCSSTGQADPAEQGIFTCTPVSCPPGVFSTPERAVKIGHLLSMLSSFDPQAVETAKKVSIVISPFIASYGYEGFYRPTQNVVAVLDYGSACAMAARLDHELTHVERFGTGGNTAFDKPKQKTADTYVDFMLHEEAVAHVAQIETAEHFGCVDELDEEMQAFSADTIGQPKEDRIAEFYKVYGFKNGLRKFYVDIYRDYFNAYQADATKLSSAN